MDTERRPRSTTITAPEWWLIEVAKLKGSPTFRNQIDLAHRVARHATTRDGLADLVRTLGPLPKLDQSTISRCLDSKGISQVLVMILISEVLELPLPIYLPRDRPEAERMGFVATSHKPELPTPPVDPRLLAADREVGEIEAGVPKPPRGGHTPVLRNTGGKRKKRGT